VTATPEVLDRLVARVRHTRVVADTLLNANLDAMSCDEAVRLLHEVQMTRKSLQASEEFITARIHDAWKGDTRTPLHVEGVGMVRVFRGKDRKAWQHDALTHAVVDAHLTATEGEMPDPFTIAGWIKEAAGIGYWKAGALKALGLEVDEFCESTRGRRTVAISTDDMIGDTA
jgi:hypothetical protein